MEIHLSFAQHVIVFLVSGACIWYFCDRLSIIVDYIDDTFRLGSAFGGTIMLSVVTNLPEIAITINGSLNGNIGLAVGNILGGITIQTVLLVWFDFAGRKEPRPLSTLTSSKTSMLQGLYLIAILSFVIIGKQFSGSFIFSRVTPPELFIALAWIGSIATMKRFQQSTTENTTLISANKLRLTRRSSIAWLIVVSVVVLIFGVLLESTSQAITAHLGINGVLFGATVLAVITSLPEISSGLSFVKERTYQPIISDIFGGNAFLPVLFLPASLITNNAIIPNAGNTDIYLTAVSIVMVAVYLMGMIIANPKKVYGLGTDSWIVLAVYIFSVIGLFYL